MNTEIDTAPRITQTQTDSAWLVVYAASRAADRIEKQYPRSNAKSSLLDGLKLHESNAVLARLEHVQAWCKSFHFLDEPGVLLDLFEDAVLLERWIKKGGL